MKYLYPRAAAIVLALCALGGSARCQSFNGASVAATVNGESITVDDWIGRMQNLRYQDFILSQIPFRPKTGTAGQIALEGLVNSKIVLQYAKKVSLLPSEAELDAAMADAKKQPAIANALQSRLISEPALREELRLQKALFNVATVNKSVTPAEVQAYYESHKESYGSPEAWRIGVVRVTGKAAADKVAAELKAGKPFEQVATELSEDTETKKRSGELGTFATSDPAIPAFIREPLSKLKVGEVSAPVISTQANGQQLYFFLRLLGKKEKMQVPFDQVKSQVEHAALFEKAGGGNAKVTELRKEAQIEITLPGYQDMFKK